MFYARASALAEGRIKSTDIPTWEAKLGALEGEEIHAALTEKFRGMGRYLDQEQVLFAFEDKTPGNEVEGILTGTPDMFWHEATTLYVVDWKTVSKKQYEVVKNKGKSAWWNQLPIYGYLVQKQRVNPRRKVVLEIHLYVRDGRTTEEIVNQAPTKVFQQTVSYSDLVKNVESYLEEILGKYYYANSSKVALLPTMKSRREEITNYLCKSCNSRLLDKKYKVAQWYLCYGCFYTSATQAEFEERTERILEKLKEGNGRTKEQS